MAWRKQLLRFCRLIRLPLPWSYLSKHNCRCLYCRVSRPWKSQMSEDRAIVLTKTMLWPGCESGYLKMQLWAWNKGNILRAHLQGIQAVYTTELFPSSMRNMITNKTTTTGTAFYHLIPNTTAWVMMLQGKKRKLSRRNIIKLCVRYSTMALVYGLIMKLKTCYDIGVVKVASFVNFNFVSRYRSKICFLTRVIQLCLEVGWFLVPS